MNSYSLEDLLESLMPLERFYVYNNSTQMTRINIWKVIKDSEFDFHPLTKDFYDEKIYTPSVTMALAIGEYYLKDQNTVPNFAYQLLMPKDMLITNLKNYDRLMTLPVLLQVCEETQLPCRFGQIENMIAFEELSAYMGVTPKVLYYRLLMRDMWQVFKTTKRIELAKTFADRLKDIALS